MAGFGFTPSGDPNDPEDKKPSNNPFGSFGDISSNSQIWV
jgi:hypothetical protein